MTEIQLEKWLKNFQAKVNKTLESDKLKFIIEIQKYKYYLTLMQTLEQTDIEVDEDIVDK